MGITRSLSSGGSSLRAHQQRFDVISNNIANANTTGFKSSRASFVEMFNQIQTFGKSPEGDSGTGAGGINPLQFGLGVRMGAVTPDMSQGALETTTRSLDLALQGDGFFVLSQNGQQVYSRAGAFALDSDGYLVDSTSGAFVQGYNLEVDSTGKMVKDASGQNILNRQVESLQIEPTTISEPRQTQNISLQGNLSATAAEGTERKASITVFDNQGGSRTLALTFTKTANANEWTVAASIDGNDVAPDTTTIQFNADGTLNTPTALNITAADLNTAIGSQVFDETTPKDMSISLLTAGNLGSSLTQFSGPNTVTISEQDGFQAGDLSGLSVDKRGVVWGSFTNGQSEVLGQVVIAKFSNPEGLLRQGDNFYQESPNSGIANLGTASEIFSSTSVIGSALESSNVDLTTEFVDMISTQRAFEAASRIVTVSDQMLSTINLLKR